MIYDVIVIGAGPSGLMAAISAAEHGAHTLLLEKGQKPGNKLAISGGGRCNVTNRLPQEDIIKHIPGNGKFLYSAFSVFNNYDIIDFFENMGVRLKEEDHGRMFPVSNSSKSVVDTLLRKLKSLHVDMRLNTPVKTIDYHDTYHTVILRDGKQINGRAVVIAAGGMSVPHTGSTGDGYAWAKKAGHTITDLYPTEVPLTSDEDFIKHKELQGLSLRHVALTVLNQKEKPIITHRMDMIFTHFGISGPAVLRCSQFVVKELRKGAKKVLMSIDILPDKPLNTLVEELIHLTQEHPKRTIKNGLKGLLPDRLITVILKKHHIDENSQLAHISHELLRDLATSLKDFRFYVNGSLPIEKAFVTGGGVSIKEIFPKTMKSKIMERLFFCGEILDIHGYTGGYNITVALVTGRLAGMNAALEYASNAR